MVTLALTAGFVLGLTVGKEGRHCHCWRRSSACPAWSLRT